MEHLVQTAILHRPVANQLRVCGAQVDLLIGQFEEGGVLMGVDAVGAKLVEGFMLLLGASVETCTSLQRGGDVSHDPPDNSQVGGARQIPTREGDALKTAAG